MEDQSSTGNSQHQYPPTHLPRIARRNTVAETLPNSPSSIAGSPQVPTHIDLLPILFPQHSSYHQQQLAQYNRLIASGRSTRILSSPLPPVLSAHHIQAVPGSRSGSSGGNTARHNKTSTRGGHGNKEARKSSKGERALIAEKEAPPTMPAKRFELSNQLPTRPPPQHQNSNVSHQSSSVPSTPHQHARKFSFESREPSPTATNNHSPRSAYSESNITLSSSRPIPPLRGGCRYETAMAHTKRRMPYSVGTERLEKLNAADLKSKLSEDAERKLTTDMRELYDRLKPTPETDDKKDKLVKKLEKLFNEEWPGHDIQVHVFGSTGNLLCTDESDVDICITTDWKVLEGVCMIADLLAKSGMKEVICVSTAKVPIVKILDPELNIACDMNVNNTLALENTRMIKTYVEIDPRVRPLAMIIKHWTKRRIVNDAAFGGTLSSYTWICMIINFLQSRNPPVLPALHQRPHMKLPRKDGHDSEFADDLDALRGFGKKNGDSLGALLLAFFKFYGHDFDYDNLVISVRNGRQITKTEKKWHLGNNNFLCVEEPFNTGRNLGNTADETSFRGLHLELRRAFDLVSAGNLDECCEQYEFPKEEKPPQRERQTTKSKPAIIRSASQSNASQSNSQAGRGGRGGGRGGRHNNNQRNSSSNRRASSAAFENNPAYFFPALPSGSSAQDLWLQHQAQAQLHNDLFQTYSVLQAQENNLRLQLYNQNQAFMQAHSQGQNQSFSQTQTRGNAPPVQQQATDRNRTNSFDQPPLTAPIRPEMYYYPLHYAATPVYGYQTSSTNPSSPSMSSAVPELRRSMHRSSVTSGSGGPSSSSLRSHSQPAARSAPSPLSLQGSGTINHGLGIYQPYRHIPNFIADENSESGFDTPSESIATTPPEESTPREYVGYYVNGSGPTTQRRESLAPMAIPAFGDIQQQSRRRLSTDQLPQSILDRLKRPSRSPSPLGHDRSYSTGAHSAPLTAVSSQQGTSIANIRSLNNQVPLVVNGSNVPAPISIPHWQASVSGGSAFEDPSMESAAGSVDSSSQFSGAGSDLSFDQGLSGQRTPKDLRSSGVPMVVNGSNNAKVDPVSTLTSPPVVNGVSHQPSPSNGLTLAELGNGALKLSPNSRNRLGRQAQNGGMSPLDIGFGHIENQRDDAPHLSPVYEARTPSPTANRKFEPGLDRKSNRAGLNILDENFNVLPKLNAATGPHMKQAPTDSNANGHTRASKSEGGGSGSWQKIPKNKKKGTAAESKVSAQGQSFTERRPNDVSERKGG